MRRLFAAAVCITLFAFTCNHLASQSVPGGAVFPTTGSPPPPDPHLVGHWLINEGGAATVALDSSGNGNNGAWQGSKVCGGSNYQGGYVFVYAGCLYDSTSTFINVGNASILNPTTGITLSVWVHGYNSNFNGFFISRDDATLGRSYAMGKTATAWNLQINGATIISLTQAINPLAWFHLCASGDSSSGYTLFLDGASIGTAAWTAPATATGPTYIGGRSYSGSPSFPEAQAEDARIYDNAQSCAAIYAAGPGV